MGSESIAHEAKGRMGYWLRSLRARGIIVDYKTLTLASKTPFSHHCLGFQSRRLFAISGLWHRPSSSSTNQNAALIIWILLNMWQHSVKKDKKVSFMVFYAKTDNLEKLAKTSTILSIIWKKKDLALSVIACMQTSPIEEIGDVCTRGNASDNDN